MIQNQLVDLPVDERSAEKIAYTWIRSTIGNIPHVGTPVKKGEIWNVPVHVNYPRIFKDITTERPQKLRFMSFKNIGEVKIDAIKGLIVDKPTFYQVQHKISENLTLVQKTVQKALVKVGANYFAELPFPSHMHTPLLDVLSWLLVNDRIDVSVDFEQINEEERKKYQQNIDILMKYGLVEIEGNIITPGNYLIEIESRGKNYHERLSKALSFFFERGYEEIDSIYQVVGPYLTLSSICYERSFEYGGVLPQDYFEIESIFMETYRAEIKRIKLPRYLVQLEAVNILESKTIGGKISWSANENLFNKMCLERDILEPIAGLIEG
jgi:hypothetical protein